MREELAERTGVSIEELPDGLVVRRSSLKGRFCAATATTAWSWPGGRLVR